MASATTTTTTLDLTDEQQMIRDTVREFAQGELAPLAAETDAAATFPDKPLAALAELGFLGLPLPEAYGGAGADALSYVLMIEELARVCGSTALIVSSHLSQVAAVIEALGTDEQKREFLPALASGEKLGALGLRDDTLVASADGDAGETGVRAATLAKKTADGWELSGRKPLVAAGARAGVVVVAAKSAADDGWATFVAAGDTPGFAWGDPAATLGCRGAEACPLTLKGAVLADAALLGASVAPSAERLARALDGARLAHGALALGLAEAAFDYAVAYVQERRQFDRPIGSFAGIAFRVADMEVAIAAARHLVYHAARLKAAKRPYAREAAIAKLAASETAVMVTAGAVQCLGGNGFSREYPVERFYRDAKLTAIDRGSTIGQRRAIARHALPEIAADIR